MTGAARLRLGGLELVGRDAELATVRTAVAATDRGAGGVLFLVGEAGIGKSRLAAEAMRLAADAGQRVLRGRATAPTVQFRPLSEALMSVVRRSGLPQDPLLVPYRPALARLVPEWRGERLPGADDSPVVLAEAVLRLLVSLGGGRGCVAVLEDLHDADGDTLDVIEYLVDNLAQEPVLVVATVRTEAGAGLELVRAAQRRRAATVLELGRLDAEAVRHLAAGLLDVRPEEVPEPVLDRLWEAADGVPFHVEELLAGMVGEGAVVHSGAGWRVSGPWPPRVPVTLGASLALRVDRLGPRCRALLRSAALLGRRFPAVLAGAAVGVTGAELSTCLRAAGEAQIVQPDDEADMYVFRHALTAEALRAALPPAERTDLARRAAEAIEESGSELSLSWGHLAVQLWVSAGNNRRAAELLSMVGRQAWLQGAVSTAIALTERGLTLLEHQPVSDPTVTDLREVLLDALIDAGQIERAVELGIQLDVHASAGRRAAAHLRLARAATAAGQWSEGLRQVATVRELLGADAEPTALAEVDAVDAWLSFCNPTADRMTRAESLAVRALGAAEETKQPEVACAALEVLASCVRLRDLTESGALCDRALAVAEEHGLTTWRIRLLFHLGVLDVVHNADPKRLVNAYETAVRAGAVITALVIQCELAIVYLTRAEYDRADECAQRSEDVAGRLRLTETRLIALALRICVASHRGRRGHADELLDDFRRLGGEDIDHSAAVWGLGLSFCSLLEEDRDRAWRELRQAVAKEEDRPPHYLSFNRGPHLLVGTLVGELGWEQHDELAASAHGQARWNQQFVLLARAIMEGREGRDAAAEATVEQFEHVAEVYPLVRHLGLRLIAECAIVDGWGRPYDWLCAAEPYLHAADVPRVTARCRALLREIGARVPQRRRGSEQIPPPLRRLGVTVREDEVLRLVAQRLGNKEIARRLVLSPRTVEKHVANLLAKTGQLDRSELVRYAVQALQSSERTRSEHSVETGT